VAGAQRTDTATRGTPPTGASGATGATAATGRTGVAPPVVVPPTVDSTDIRRRADSIAAAARTRAADSAAAEDRRRAADAAGATRRALCEDGAGAEQALRRALASNVSAQISTLYQARDAADTRVKTDLVNSLRDAQQLRTSASAVRNEPAGDACDWVMAVQFSYRTFVGGTRDARYEMRMRLEPAGGEVRVGRLFGARRQ
jgi:hypothetical protein